MPRGEGKLSLYFTPKPKVMETPKLAYELIGVH